MWATVSTGVWYNGNLYPYKTNFELNPTKCADFEEMCSDKEISYSSERMTYYTSTTASSAQTNSSTDGTDANLNENESLILVAGICSGTVVFLMIFVLVVLAICKRQKSTRESAESFKMDENHVYGIYSRGSMEDGEYGDGDVMEVTDTNYYYA